MNRKIIAAGCCCLMIAGLLMLGGCAQKNETASTPHNDRPNKEDTAVSEIEDGLPSVEFSNIDISVIGADIYLVTGDKYAISYDLHAKEIVERSEVVGDTLYFSTRFDWEWKPDYGDFRVTVTVPEDAQLNHVKLSTVAGNIVDSDRTYSEAILETTSGRIELSRMNVQRIDAKTVSGGISVTESTVSKLLAADTTGSITLDGDFGVVRAYSVSSDCKLTGTLEKEANIETVSGNISVSVGDASVQAASYGTVYWNEADQGHAFKKAEGETKLLLKSVSGKIRITTE